MKQIYFFATARSSTDNWCTHHSTLKRYQPLNQENDEQCCQSNNFDWKINGKGRTIATLPNEADRYAVQIQTFAIPDATHFRNDNQQSIRTIVASVWIKYGESGPAHALESLLIYSFTHQVEKRKILCIP